MKKEMVQKDEKQLPQDLLTTNINLNNGIKKKMKKVIIPTITILVFLAIAICLIFILKTTK